MTTSSPLLTGSTAARAQSLASSASSTSSTAASSSTTANGTTASSNSLSSMDSFLTLFLTQLQYQDPTNPMESYELSSQLAQFSTVEQLSTVNTNLEAEQTLLASINNAQMVEMVGKQVTGQYDSIQVKEGAPTQAQFEIEDAAASVTVTISDSSGNAVKTITLGATEAGQHNIEWDGTNDDGEAVSDGTYTVAVEATDANGDSLDVTQTVTGKAFAFRMENSTPYLILDCSGGLMLPISYVMEVQESTS